MRSYLIQDDRVVVLTSASAADKSKLVQSLKDLDQVRFPVPRLLTIWNALPGAEPIKRFTSRTVAVKRLWAAFEALPITSSRTTSKQAKLVAMLQRPSGASMDQLTTATGWQAHSVRGLMSGVLRKKLKMNVASVMEGSRRIYRIAA